MERTHSANKMLVLLSDFGLSERFVASMKGVALSVNPGLIIHDLTHTIEPFNIWEAAQTLSGTIAYWPKGTVFVAVVDPGVGTDRQSVVALTNSGHFIVTPDNGTLTLVSEQHGIAALRIIDETVNRLPGSADAHTFHGRDVYAYTGARLAAGVISFKEVGPVLKRGVIKLKLTDAEKISDSTIRGAITKVEKPFGNIVTNIPKALFDELDMSPDGKHNVGVEIIRKNKHVYHDFMPYVKSFGYVAPGKSLLYSDSNGFIGLAINGGNFSTTFNIGAGVDWLIKLRKNQAE